MNHRAHTRQQGIAMTEFTIVLPVLLLLLFGVTEIGRVLVRYNALTKAVQDGARYAAAYAILGTTGAVNIDAQLMSEVRNVVVYGNPTGSGSPTLPGLQPSQIQVIDGGGDIVRVDVAYPYQPLFANGLPIFRTGSSLNTAFTMQASVTMRAL